MFGKYIRGPWRQAAALFAALLAITGCEPRDGRTDVKLSDLLCNDFEALGQRATPVPSLSSVRAHSGRFALRVDSATEFSYTLRNTLGQLTAHRPRRFVLSAWAWVPSPSDDAALEVIINDPNNPEQPLMRQHLYLATTGGFGKWKHLQLALDLPSYVHSHHEVVIYMWRRSARSPVYIDDVCLAELW